MLYFKFFLLFSILCVDLKAFPILTVDELSQDAIKDEFIGKEIQLRGFIYPFGDAYVLDSQPNLKSCCIGPSKRPQILVKNLNNVEMDRTITLRVLTVTKNLLTS